MRNYVGLEIKGIVVRSQNCTIAEADMITVASDSNVVCLGLWARGR